MTAEGIAQMATDPTMHPARAGDGRPTASYTLRVNGFERPVSDAWIGESLLYVLRERLGLAGAKNGCEQGECGACSVQVDGQLVAGCLVPAALAADSEIATVEGLSAGGTASDVQQALADSGAVQCGYCTPGMAMAVHDLLQRNHRPTEVEARQALCGNLCRCTGYRSVLAAVQTVSEGRAAALVPTEQTAEPAERTGPAEQPAPPEQQAAATSAAVEDPADPPVYQDGWSGTRTAGEVPVFAAEEGWISAEEVGVTAAGTGLGAIPAQGYPGYEQTAYGPGTVYASGGYEQTPAHGTAAAPFEGTPAMGTPYEPTPAHGVPVAGFGAVPAQGAGYEPTPPHGAPVPGYDGTPAHGMPTAGYDGTPAHGMPAAAFDGTPAHGTVYQAPPAYPADPYAANYPGYDPLGLQGTPAHGVPAADPFDGAVYETAPGTPETGAPAHGLLLPEDDHA